MAHMYLPGKPLIGTQSEAERNIFQLLQQRLDDSYQVFHSLDWQFRNKEGKIVDGEADFIILHRQKGVIALEVKGGGIRYNNQTGKWISRDRFGKDHQLNRSPIAQAKGARGTLARFLGEMPQTKKHAKVYQIVAGVWFPDIIWNDIPRFDLPSDCFLDSRDLSDPEKSLDRLFALITLTEPMNEDDVTAFCEALAPSVNIESGLLAQMQANQSDTLVLTIEQANRFWNMRFNPRIMIKGNAGTGKTVLAYEVSWRLARNNKRVLLLNYTPFQAEKLRAEWHANRNPQKPDFSIHYIRSLAEELAELAAKPKTEIGNLRINFKSDQRRLAEIMRECIDTLRRKMPPKGETLWQYDAILIDEAQDIEKDVLQEVERLLDSSKQTNLCVFYDPAQRVDFPDDWDSSLAGDFALLPLRNNCRNTRPIYELMQRYNPALEDIPFRGPDGSPVEYNDPMDYANLGGTLDEAIYRTLKTTLDKLIYDEKIRPADIMIITCRTNAESRWKKWREADDFPMKAYFEKNRSGSIGVITIRSAKGLESKIAILVEVDGLTNTLQRDKLLYLAVSRARFKLIVIGSPQDILPSAELDHVIR